MFDEPQWLQNRIYAEDPCELCIVENIKRLENAKLDIGLTQSIFSQISPLMKGVWHYSAFGSKISMPSNIMIGNKSNVLAKIRNIEVRGNNDVVFKDQKNFEHGKNISVGVLLCNLEPLTNPLTRKAVKRYLAEFLVTLVSSSYLGFSGFPFFMELF